MKIAFTSCMDALTVPRQIIWRSIREAGPDVLLLLGDQIYMDWREIGPSNWKREIEAGGARAVQRFAKEMHRRYEAQARVADFSALLHDMRVSGKSVIMAWDDHDFAWNNAMGSPPDFDEETRPEAIKTWNDHGVPFAEIKSVSARLFAQFSQFSFDPTHPYPAMEDAVHIPRGCAELPWPKQLRTAGESIDFMLLDTRWFRTPRNFQGSTILGEEQRNALLEAVSKPHGLLILAGGTPMRHRYLLGSQDWTSGDSTDEFQEYGALLDAARRPVLYLSGDVHFNAWGGFVKRWGTEDSRIIQILATPAAIGNVYAKEFPSCYGLLDIDMHGAAVACQLVEGDASLGERFRLSPGEPAGGRRARFSSTGWMVSADDQPLDGEASEEATWLNIRTLDIQPMPVLCSVERKATGGDLELEASLGCLDEIDALFKETINAGGGPTNQGALPVAAPEPFFGRVDRQQGRFDLCTAPSRLCVMAQAFEAAAERKTSVVLFIHGVGKTPIDAIDQGYALRALYGCEPIVFCWPIGVSIGRLGRAMMTPGKAARGIAATSGILFDLLREFGKLAWQEFNAVPSIILARSSGAELLRNALAGGAPNQYIGHVRRIVLSSAACSANAFDAKYGNAFNMPDCRPTFVTINQLDRTLRLADWAMSGTPLGARDPRKLREMSAVRYLEFQSVGRLHDYLLVRLSKDQLRMNQAMLTATTFEPGNAGGIQKYTQRPDIFTVR